MAPATPVLLALAAALATPLAAQCPPLSALGTPFTVPLAAGAWSISHTGPALNAGEIDYVIISLPAPVPLPFTAFPGLFCNVVGNTPCIYAQSGINWFNFGPSPGANATVTLSWPIVPALSGIVFVSQFGTAGCRNGMDQSVVISVQIQ